MPHCAAFMCSNDAKKKDLEISFHRLPGENRPDVRKKWIHAIGRPENNLPKVWFLCSAHFEQSCFDESLDMKAKLMGSSRIKRKLKEDSIPTIFSHLPAVKLRRTSVDRHERKQHNEILQSILENSDNQKESTNDELKTTETQQSMDIEHDDYSVCVDPVISKSDIAVQTEGPAPTSMTSIGIQTDSASIHHEDKEVQCSLEENILDKYFELSSNEGESEEYDSDLEWHYSSSQETQTTSSQDSNQCNVIDDSELLLVHASKLKQLLRYCPDCGSLVDQEDTKVYGNHEGTLMTVELTCVNSCTYTWKSQKEMENAKGSVNIMLTSAITLSGIMLEKFQQLASLLNLRSISNSAFYSLRREYVVPAIAKEWEKEQNLVIASIREKGEPVMLAGDGRADSPGHSAKYGTYTMMNVDTDKIVDFEVVQVMDVKNSNAMEKQGFIDTLSRIESNCEVIGISTDRHLQIKKYMREEHPQKIHQIDPWHLSKSITKKITAASKKKNCGELIDWNQSVLNHFWWSVDSCGGDPESLVERFTSVIHHIVNRHEWPGCTFYKECEHGPLPQEVQRQKKWMKGGSPAHVALTKIVKDKRLLKDMKQCCLGVATTMLEVYHSLYLKYLPKIQHFSYEIMVAGTQLAALDHNKNVQRNHAVIATGEREGEGRYKIKWSKVTHKFTAQPVLEKKSYHYLKDIISEAMANVENGQKVKEKATKYCMAPTDKGDRNDIIAKTIKYARF